MSALVSVADIVALYAARGHVRYGEGVSQVQHAVQCATLAAAGSASPALIAAALLHDIGHLIAVGADHDVDHWHEDIGATALSSLFGAAVCAPIALHVAAKRYLCGTDSAYCATLSAASQRSLARQGGAFDAAAGAAFERLSYAREAILLRRYDDHGKCIATANRTFVDFLPVLGAAVAGR